MINRLVCPYSDVHLNNNPHISGKEKNRDCKCANNGKDPEMKILKIQNPEKDQEKPVSCCEHNKTYSSEERLGHERIEPLPGSNSSTKNQIAEQITIPRDKLPQSKSHTGEELGSHSREDDTPTMAQSNSVLNETAKALLRPQSSKNEEIHTYYIGKTHKSHTGNGPGFTGSSKLHSDTGKSQSQTGSITSNIESNDPKLDKLIQATETLIQLEAEGVEIIAPDGMSFPLGSKQTYKNFNKKFTRGMRTESGGSLKDYHSWRKGLATLNRNQRLLDYKNKTSWLNIMLETDFIDIITAGDSHDVNDLIMKHFTRDMAVQIMEHLAPEVLFNDDYRHTSRQMLLADCVRTDVNDEGRMILITVMGTVLNRQYRYSAEREVFPVKALLEIWNVITCNIRAGNDEYDARMTGLQLIDRYFENWTYASCPQHYDTPDRKTDTAENIKARPKAKCSIKGTKAEKNGNSCQTSMEQNNLLKIIPDMVAYNFGANNSSQTSVENNSINVLPDKIINKTGSPTLLIGKVKCRIDPHTTLKLLSFYAEIFQSELSNMLKSNYSDSTKKRDNSFSYFSIKRRRFNPQATFCNHKGTISLWNRTMTIYGYADQPLNYIHNYCDLITTGVRWEEKRKRNQSRKSSHLAIMNQTSNTTKRITKVHRCSKELKCKPTWTKTTEIKQRRTAKPIANKIRLILEHYEYHHADKTRLKREPLDYERKSHSTDKVKNAAGLLAINSRRETWKRRKRKAICY
jgi:hypothetical protein